MSDSEEPKIIVDEDWKSQVEKEKEELRTQETEAPDTEAPPIPEASFQILLATLAHQAMAMMGLMPDIDGHGAPPANLPMAKHLVDMIGVLEEKTKGNLTTEESTALEENLHQLRMAFVAVSQNQGNRPNAETDSSSGGSIQLP